MSRSLSFFALLSLLAACGTAPSSTSSDSQDLRGKKKHTCHSNADCGALEYCDTSNARSCNARGVCAPRGINLFCIETEVPVCGCDGNTYPNDCFAHKAGTSVAYRTACKCDSKDAPIDGDTLAEQPFTDASQTYFYSFTGNGTVDNNDGTFVMQIEWPCLRTEPYCKIATPAPKTGHFYTWDSTLELDYDSGDVAFFDAAADCHGTLSLEGWDQGQELTLTVSPILP